MLRYLTVDRPRHTRLSLENVAGIPLLILPGVFNPALFPSSPFFAAELSRSRVQERDAVLDLGTGCGLLAICAAQRASRVVAIDINPEAVRCARVNVALNHMEDRVEVRSGDLFEPAHNERFNLILFNPPFYRGAPASSADRAFRAEGLAERFASGLGSHLADGGRTLVVLSTDAEIQTYLGPLVSAGFRADEVARRDLATERLLIYEVRGER